MTVSTDPARRFGLAGGNDATDQIFRFLAWGNLFALGMLVFQIWAVMIMGLDGPSLALRGEGGAVAWIMLLLYPAAIAAAGIYVNRTPLDGLRLDADRITAFNMWIVRGAFFAVLFVGLADAVISFLRIEGLIAPLFGAVADVQLGRSLFRGPWIHLPLIGLGFVLALFARTLGFHWLALMIVVAELLIVISRFVFSYEQSFMGDLVRFWYAALFLFASAYTLLDEGHVRVDVFYAGFARRTKGRVNAFGAVMFGMLLCWVILLLGTATPASVLIGPMLGFETTQTTTGLYVKYLMAGFLLIFAITMLIQFAAMLLDSVADARGRPGQRETAASAAS